MHYHIVLTEKCNLQCRYCYGKSMEEFDNGLEEKFDFDFSDPCVSKVEVAKLKTFIDKDPEATIIFYGGEPLLQIPKIKEIMDNIDIPFRIQTNGMLLHKLPAEYVNRIGKMLVSLDGDSTRTNFNRGKDTYEKVLENIQFIRENGYKGEIVARMTIDQQFTDLFEQVIYLVNLINQGLIDSIHWQLDVGFYKEDYEKEKMTKFFKKYNSSVEKLLTWWMNQMSDGKICRLYPFVGIVNPILNKVKECGLRCGAGQYGHAITTSGKVVACPIMNSIEDFKTGSLETNPSDLKKLDCKDICGNCSVYGLCGGRCMYWKRASLWPNEGNEMICNSVRFYINKIKDLMPIIEDLIKKGIISKEDFDYEDYFGPEIIP